MSLDDIARAIYESRPRRVPWAELTEVGWKLAYRQMAEAAVNAIDADPLCPRCVFENAIADLVDAGEFIRQHNKHSLSDEEEALLTSASSWLVNDTISRFQEDGHDRH